jgi:photosystem II stability/assembly factor-like uncharacterized protein
MPDVKQISARTVSAVLASALVWLGSVQPVRAQSDVWTPTGLEGRYLLTLAMDPGAPTTLYASACCTAPTVFKTMDGGQTWSPLTAAPLAEVNALAIDPLMPTTLYAGWARGFGGGVHKSTDGGSSWSAVGAGTRGNVRALAINPVAPATLYAGTSGDPPTQSGVYKSSDGGVTWTAMKNGMPDYAVFSLAIDPQTPDTVYAGTSGGAFKSTNGGASWTAINDGLNNFYVFVLTIDPQDPRILYAAGTRFENDVALGEIYKSTGGSWTRSNQGLPVGPRVNAVVLDPQATTTLYAGLEGDGGVYKSTDGGVSWTAMNDGLTNLDVGTLAIDPRNPTRLYAGTGGGGVFAITMTRRFDLTVDTVGDGAGTVTSAPEGITCGDDCTELYPSGTSVTLEAVPAADSLFTTWSGCDSVEGMSCTVTMDSARSLTAGFDLKRFVLRVRKSGLGKGTVTSIPEGIDCGSDCDEPYVIRTTVTLTATPTRGIVAAWRGCDANSGPGTTSTCTLTMSRPRLVTMNFLGVPR